MKNPIPELVVILSLAAVAVAVCGPVRGDEPIFLSYWLDGLVAVAFLGAVFAAVRAFVGENRKMMVAVAVTLLCVPLGLYLGVVAITSGIIGIVAGIAACVAGVAFIGVRSNRSTES